MRTARLPTVRPGGGACVAGDGGASMAWGEGHAWLGAVHGWGRGHLWLAGVCGWVGACMAGGGVHAGAMHTPMDRMTDTCKNITFPQLRWWGVITIV